MADTKDVQLNKVLLVTFSFPPAENSGARRPGGLAKYLPNYGWDAVVITRRHKDRHGYKNVYETDYHNISADIKEKLGLRLSDDLFAVLLFPFRLGLRNLPKVLHAGASLVSSVGSITRLPYDGRDWYATAISSATNIIRKENIRAIITTSPPAIVNLIGYELKRETGLPWIADFRDLWSQNHYHRYSKARLRIETMCEKRIMKRADRLITVSEPLANKLGRLHCRKVDVITNGYDPDDFLELEPGLTHRGKFTITYTGEIYGGLRNPKPLFSAIEELLRLGLIARDELEVHFYGSEPEVVRGNAEECGINDVVFAHPPVSRVEALRIQVNSSILLLLFADDPEEDGVYTGKLFEYLGARRPILAVGRYGRCVKEMLERTKAGYFASDINEIKRFLLNFYAGYKRIGFVRYEGVTTEIEKYTHEAMAERFATLIETVVNGGRR